jgi:hypothetical protein
MNDWDNVIRLARELGKHQECATNPQNCWVIQPLQHAIAQALGGSEKPVSYPNFDQLASRLDALERQLGAGAAAWSHMVGIEKRVSTLEKNVLNHERLIGKSEDRFQRHKHRLYGADHTSLAPILDEL